MHRLVGTELSQIVKDLGGKVFDDDCQQAISEFVTEPFGKEFFHCINFPTIFDGQ